MAQPYLAYPWHQQKGKGQRLQRSKQMNPKVLAVICHTGLNTNYRLEHKCGEWQKEKMQAQLQLSSLAFPIPVGVPPQSIDRQNSDPEPKEGYTQKTSLSTHHSRSYHPLLMQQAEELCPFTIMSGFSAD